MSEDWVGNWKYRLGNGDLFELGCLVFRPNASKNLVLEVWIAFSGGSELAHIMKKSNLLGEGESKYSAHKM